MVLSNNHLGGLSKVTSYQSQSVCFSLFYSFSSVCCSCSISPSLSGFAWRLWPCAPWPVTLERLFLLHWMQLQIKAKTLVEAMLLPQPELLRLPGTQVAFLKLFVLTVFVSDSSLITCRNRLRKPWHHCRF